MTRRPRAAWRRMAWIVGILLVPISLVVGSVAADLSTPRDLHASEYVGSAACRRCHENRYGTWHRTFHRTMTAEATASTVLGDFTGAQLEYLGVTARMHQDRAGRFKMTFSGAGGQRTVEVTRTVGAHRYQQYLARDRDVLYRLPVAWHVGDQRWFHMNEAFLTPDPPEPPVGETVAEEDYNRHVVRWNDNCVFCHNVSPNPGLTSSGFQTETAELGIACEACHGPGSLHAALNANPARRYALHLFGSPDPTIVNPSHLSSVRSAEVCARCHGQRITDDIGEFLRNGDPYVPGEDLALYSAPLWRDTRLEGQAGMFEARFWADGTPRLTAYEYQGMLQSACAQRGQLTCTTCHGMHDADPRGQIRPEARGDAGCVGCHDELSGAEAARDHSAHEHEGGAVPCASCHMPPVVYGLVAIHPSHRLEVPEPERDERFRRPDACTGCHVDETRQWAIRQRRRLWPIATRADMGGHGLRGPEQSPARTDVPDDLSEVGRALLAGDPVERAAAAAALGRTGPPASESGRAGRLGLLLDAMEHDPYPAVRRIALRSARRVGARWRGPFERYDPTGRLSERRDVVRAIVARLPPGAVHLPAREMTTALRAEAAHVAIEIGE